MATMKAVCLERFGGPEALKVTKLERPEPGFGEVLIHVHAASVNPVDYKTRAGQYPPVTQDSLPRVLGRDISGTVESVGEGVTHFKPGDDVYALLDRDHGGYTQYVALSADLCAPKPAKLDYTAAAAVPLAAITAWQGLFDQGELMPGQRVLIHGGGGGVGHFAIQLAKSRGAEVITTVSAEDKEFVQSIGADQVIDYKAEKFEEKVKDVDLVFDLVDGETQERSWQVLKDGGTLISTLSQPSSARAMEHHARVTSYMAQPNAEELQQIGKLIDEGKIRPHVEITFPLERAAEAQRRLESAHTRGKVVLQVEG